MACSTWESSLFVPFPRHIHFSKSIVPKKVFLEYGIRPAIRVSFKWFLLGQLAITFSLAFTIRHVKDVPQGSASLNNASCAFLTETLVDGEYI